MDDDGLPQETAEDRELRSDFVREFVQRSDRRGNRVGLFAVPTPKVIIQFWDDRDHLPDDVRECMASWHPLVEQGFTVRMFDDRRAERYIRRRLGTRHGDAYTRCYHPAMRCDYFRLCYILMEGGCYVDADDAYQGSPIDHLFSDGRLKVQPLCYDISTDGMVPVELFTSPGAREESWIVYFNNNPLICAAQHPVLRRALAQATEALERVPDTVLPEIQSTTGPGNLTKAIVGVAGEYPLDEVIRVVSEWDTVAVSRWPLSYRNDERNWRRSNRMPYSTDLTTCRSTEAHEP